MFRHHFNIVAETGPRITVAARLVYSGLNGEQVSPIK